MPSPVPLDPLMDARELLAPLPAAVADGRLLDAYLLAAGALQVGEDVVEGSGWRTRRLQDHFEGRVRKSAEGAGGAKSGGAARGLPAQALALPLSASRRVLDGWTEAALRADPDRRALRGWCAAVSVLTGELADLLVRDDWAREDWARGEGAHGEGTRGDGARDEGAPAPSGVVDLTEVQDRRRLLRSARALADSLDRLPAGAARLLEGEIVRQPSCFRSFDLHPADAVELVRRFADRHPGRERRLLVVGVRTSGSYLAPLAGAALRRLGYRDVTVATSRPRAALLPGRAPLVRSVAAAGGAVLLLDDPPVTGNAVATVARRAEEAGFPADSVVPLLPVFGDEGALPAPLAGYPCVLLPGQDWEVRTRLRSKALGDAVAALLPPGERVLAATAGPQGELTRWRHLSVPLDVRVEERSRRSGGAGGSGGGPGGAGGSGGSSVRVEHLVAEWSGVGHLGRQAAELAAELAGLVPRVLGFADGVLLRERLPQEPGPEGFRARELAAEEPPAESSADTAPAERPPTELSSADIPPADLPPAAAVAGYVAARARLLSAPEDRSLRLAARQPVWEVAARLLAPGFGRLGGAARSLLLDREAQRLLAADGTACLVDGQMADPRLWSRDGRGGWRKTRWADGSFSNLDLASYDPLYDLAGAALNTPDGGRELLAAYAESTGRPVDPGRWCLLVLVQGWNAVRLAGSGALDASAARRARRAQARAVQEFLAAMYLADLPDLPDRPPGPGGGSGGFCVLDVDGVLEHDVLGFPASSPLGALALRALRAHGHRVLLATGRSAPEVADRCAAYGIDGGVAEYGAAAVTPSGITALEGGGGEHGGHRRERLRARLRAAVPQVAFDPLYRSCVRASLRGRGLPEEVVRSVLADSEFGEWFTVVRGDAQTDFLPRGVGKTTGLQGLLERLGADRDTVPLLAVGDGVADVPMLRLARLGLAPGNAEAAVRRAGITRLRRQYQAGLGDAVAHVIGHRPGGCPICRPASSNWSPEAVPGAVTASPAARLLLGVLAVPEAGRTAALGRMAALLRSAGPADRREAREQKRQGRQGRQG
ncbi:HAD hydrolase family protein [Phaeacidiphilus oryzae]|uniref:HAD hydrolase family protein n=1 Tax=Phaeacidiphilus oryzae TaxID=348818 RepID=UPI00056242F4|nr:HAD hydrolase family protein [Phaeacidiphilus oryzae]